MPRIERTHMVRHRATDMFELVSDVEKYPEFVPLCRALKVTSRREKEQRALIMANMTMAYQLLSETFTTQVLLDRENLEINTKYVDGPFKHLDNQWRFEESGENNCLIHFMVDYELKNSLLSAAARVVFDTAFNRFVDAFERRADSLYG